MTLLCCSKIITLAWKVCMHVKCRDHVKILYLIFSCVEKVPTKLPDPGRLPLIELAPTDAQEVPGSATGSTHDMEGTSTVAGEGGGEGEDGKEQQQQTTDTKASKDSPKRR